LEGAEPLATISRGASRLFSRSLFGNVHDAYYTTGEYAGIVGKTVPISAF
jgi:hypothetical protein